MHPRKERMIPIGDCWWSVMYTKHSSIFLADWPLSLSMSLSVAEVGNKTEWLIQICGWHLNQNQSPEKKPFWLYHLSGQLHQVYCGKNSLNEEIGGKLFTVIDIWFSYDSHSLKNNLKECLRMYHCIESKGKDKHFRKPLKMCGYPDKDYLKTKSNTVKNTRPESSEEKQSKHT